MGFTTRLTATLALAASFIAPPAAAAPASSIAIAIAPRNASASASTSVSAGASSGYWVENIARNGAPAFGEANYQIYRNVKDFGAKGDGVTDDTAAINAAISAGGRCGSGCPSTTTTPAIVYFPAGKYLVSTPIQQYYYTQLIGDATNLPTLIASAGFTGMAVVDADPYDGGNNWFVNQNNFFRQVRNFKIDLTQMPYSAGAAIHWQVAQATSLQNIAINMRTDGGTANKQVGIFMDNGSGGFMSDLVINGGQYGAFFGNQQFTIRNLTFTNCQTAIFMNWNWAWTLQDISIQNCGVGLDISTTGSVENVGTTIFVDSVISDTPIGVQTSYSTASDYTNGTLIIDNVDMSNNVPTAILDTTSKTALLTGNTKIGSWVQGKIVPSASGSASGSAAGASTKTTQFQGSQNAISKPSGLVGSDGKIVSRSRPQYETVPASSFVSAKAKGAKGDGKTDDTAAIQALFDSITADQVAYFDHGAYVVTDTIKVPKNIRITGEAWPVIMAGGNSAFSQAGSLKAVFQVGQAGDAGSVEISDIIFATLGPQPGAVMVEWNLAGSSAGSSGMWDTHVRIGGAAGTQLQVAQCAKDPNTTVTADPACFGSGLMMHVTKSASNAYFENNWFWTADHDLEPAADYGQVSIFNGRGVLIESQGPVWLIGTASEHSVLYNYQLSSASSVYMGMIQTETPYFQGNPDARTPFASQAALVDPSFDSCTGAACARSWGLRVVDSTDVLVYGAGLYSFFDNYSQTCLDTESCQDNIVSIESSKVHIFGLSTKATTNMIQIDGTVMATDSDNRSSFCASVALVSS